MLDNFLEKKSFFEIIHSEARTTKMTFRMFDERCFKGEKIIHTSRCMQKSEGKREKKIDNKRKREEDDHVGGCSLLTREICLLFVGRTLNGQPLLEFPMSSGEPALEPLRIKRATLWTRVEFRHGHHYQRNRQSQTNQRNITLWVFRVRCGNTTHLRGKVTLYFPFSRDSFIYNYTYIQLYMHIQIIQIITE